MFVTRRYVLLDVETYEPWTPDLNSCSRSILLGLERTLNTYLMCVYFPEFLYFESCCPLFGPFVHRVCLFLWVALLHLFPIVPCSLLPLFFCCVLLVPKLCFVLNMKEIWTFKTTYMSFSRDIINYKSLSSFFFFRK